MSDKNLCQDCGLCCDGTMYSYVSLQEIDNQEQLVSLGLKQERNETVFDQPCSANQARCCSIYEARPAICRQYRCALLCACDTGSITAVEAHLLIQDTIALRDRVRPQVENFVGIEGRISLPKLFQQMVEKLEKMGAEDRKLVNAQMLLDVGTLRVLLSKRFEPRGTKLSISTESDSQTDATSSTFLTAPKVIDRSSVDAEPGS